MDIYLEDHHQEYFIKLLEENCVKNGECLEWTGKTTQGYGHIYAFKKSWSIHRVSYLIENKKIEHDLYVLHKCNNRKCFLPSHLYAGTAKDNYRDLQNAPYYAEVKKRIGESKTRNCILKEKNHPPAEFMTVEEVALHFNTHANTIRKAVRNGHIIAIRIGDGPRSPYRISRKSIDAIHDSIIRMHEEKTKKIIS